MNFAFACFVIECHFAFFYSGMLILLVKMWNKQPSFLFVYQKNHGIKWNWMELCQSSEPTVTSEQFFFLNFREYSIEKYFDSPVIKDSVHGRLYWIAKLIQFVLDWIKLFLQYISYLLIIFVLQVSKGWWHFSALIFYNFAFFCASHWHYHLLDISK